jgi:hypothetical protein
VTCQLSLDQSKSTNKINKKEKREKAKSEVKRERERKRNMIPFTLNLTFFLGILR